MIRTSRTQSRLWHRPRWPFTFDASHWHFIPPHDEQSDANAVNQLYSCALPVNGALIDVAPRPHFRPGGYTLISGGGGNNAKFDVLSGREAVDCNTSGACINFSDSFVAGSSINTVGFTVSMLLHFPMLNGTLNGLVADNHMRLNGTTEARCFSAVITTDDQSALSNGWHRVTFVSRYNLADAIERYSVYFDGELAGEVDANGNLPSTQTIIGIGNLNVGLNRDRGVAFADFFCWQGLALTADAVREHNAHPYEGMQEYGRTTIFLPAAGGGGATPFVKLAGSGGLAGRGGLAGVGGGLAA